MRSTSTRCNARRPPRNTFWTGSPSTGTTSPCPPGTTLKTTASSSIFAVKSEVNNECKTETFKRWKQINCFYNQYLWRGLWIRYKKKYYNSSIMFFSFCYRIFPAINHIPRRWRSASRQETETRMDVSFSLVEIITNVQLNVASKFSLIKKYIGNLIYFKKKFSKCSTTEVAFHDQYSLNCWPWPFHQLRFPYTRRL